MRMSKVLNQVRMLEKPLIARDSVQEGLEPVPWKFVRDELGPFKRIETREPTTPNVVGVEKHNDNVRIDLVAVLFDKCNVVRGAPAASTPV